MEKIWATEAAYTESTRSTADPQLVLGSLDADEVWSQLSEAEQQALEQTEVGSRHRGFGRHSGKADSARETGSRSRNVLAVCRTHAYAGLSTGSKRAAPAFDKAIAPAGRPWADTRLLIFTEYEDTKRYILQMLHAAMSETSLAEFRLDTFSGPTREAIKQEKLLPN